MAHTLRIQKLKFQAGSVPGAPGLDVNCPNVTVLVGPNNAGKSLALRELDLWCQGQNPEFKLIDHIELILPATIQELRAMLQPLEAAPPTNQISQVGHFWIARPTIRQGEEAVHQRVNEDNLNKWFNQKLSQQLRQVFVRMLTLRLDGRTRFDLVDQKETGALEGHPKNHLWALFVDDIAREKVRQFTEEAFGKHFVIDPTGMQYFRVRLAERRPHTKSEEQALDANARTFHLNAPLVSTLGDGVQTSVGLVSAVLSLPHCILLIDEPEAFLHPTLARRVGYTLSETARERGASLIVATHSAEFLMGCIQSAPELRLIRLTYTDGQATARSIEPTEIVVLMNDPLLRSANALRAIFHRGVIVTEADADRALYEEVNFRLLQASRGIADALFMNAQNWQTIPRIVAPLRKLGIPAAAIFDFDVLMDKNFRALWPLLNVDRAELLNFILERDAVKRLMDTIGRDGCKAIGVKAFQGDHKGRINAFIDKMALFGLFFVPVGELECWLNNLGLVRSKNKSKWLTDAFAELGSDPLDLDYVKAGRGDVWDFVDKIEKWIENPNRSGIPG